MLSPEPSSEPEPEPGEATARGWAESEKEAEEAMAWLQAAAAADAATAAADAAGTVGAAHLVCEAEAVATPAVKAQVTATADDESADDESARNAGGEGNGLEKENGEFGAEGEGGPGAGNEVGVRTEAEDAELVVQQALATALATAEVAAETVHDVVLTSAAAEQDVVLDVAVTVESEAAAVQSPEHDAGRAAVLTAQRDTTAGEVAGEVRAAAAGQVRALVGRIVTNVTAAAEARAAAAGQVRAMVGRVVANVTAAAEARAAAADLDAAAAKLQAVQRGKRARAVVAPQPPPDIELPPGYVFVRVHVERGTEGLGIGLDDELAVTELMSGGPAERASVRVSDMLVEIDGVVVSAAADVAAAMPRHSTRVVLGLKRPPAEVVAALAQVTPCHPPFATAVSPTTRRRCSLEAPPRPRACERRPGRSPPNPHPPPTPHPSLGAGRRRARHGGRGGLRAFALRGVGPSGAAALGRGRGADPAPAVLACSSLPHTPAASPRLAVAAAARPPSDRHTHRWHRSLGSSYLTCTGRTSLRWWPGSRRAAWRHRTAASTWATRC